MLVPTALQVLGGEGQEADGRKGTKVGREGGERQDKKGRGRQGRKSREEREKRGPVKTRSRGENGSYTDRKPRPLPAPHGASLEH